MSKNTEVVVPKTGAVTPWESKLAAMAAVTSEQEKAKGDWVSFRGGIFTINGKPMAGNKAEVVVIGSIHENQFYKDRFDPNNPQPPVCYAFADTAGELAPHPEAPSPQASSCAECPNNAWGSDPAGGKGKACKNVRRLALIAADDLDKVDSAPVYLAKIPITSVKNWATYASEVSNVLKRPPLGVKTTISVVPNAKTQFQVEFSFNGKIEDDGGTIQSLINRNEAIRPLLYSPYDKPTAAPAVADDTNKKF
jgi:hypothetical protein